jgi:1,4-alpha-glucan branching enzyme
VWLQGTNDWVYRHLHKASRVMTDLAKHNPNVNGVRRRALNQALRELLLAQSSDWAFIMATGTHVSYAERRTKDHLLRFFKLADDIHQDNIDENFVKELESKDNIFPEIDYRVHQ